MSNKAPKRKASLSPFRAKPIRLRRHRPGTGALGLSSDNPLEIAKQIRAGFAFSRMVRFQKFTRLPWDKLARFVSIPTRTLTRRQHDGVLQPEESDRVWRASRIFEMAVDLFEGDVDRAREWLQTPQPALADETPLELAATEVGAREVEHLIGRLEHGVFT